MYPPKTRPILYPKLRRGFLGGVCFCALHGYVKNLADFRPKPSAQDISGRMQYAPTRVHTQNPPDFRPKPSAMLFQGRMQYAPTRVRAKPARFHIPAHGYTKNLPGFIPKPSAQDISGRMQYAPTRVRAKPAQFHISTHVPAKNAPDFTLPNRDAPKTCPVLGANPCRRTFRGVCFCAPTRVRAKPARFHISASGYAKNAPDFTFPNRDTPKTRLVLGANPCRRTFRGVCFCAPTRVRAKPARF